MIRTSVSTCVAAALMPGFPCPGSYIAIAGSN
jgi:hypothetical protein